MFEGMFGKKRSPEFEKAVHEEKMKMLVEREKSDSEKLKADARAQAAKELKASQPMGERVREGLKGARPALRSLGDNLRAAGAKLKNYEGGGGSILGGTLGAEIAKARGQPPSLEPRPPQKPKKTVTRYY